MPFLYCILTLEPRKTEDEKIAEHFKKVDENLEIVNQLRVRIKRFLHRLNHRSDDIPSFITEMQDIRPDLRDKVNTFDQYLDIHCVLTRKKM